MRSALSRGIYVLVGSACVILPLLYFGVLIARPGHAYIDITDLTCARDNSPLLTCMKVFSLALLGPPILAGCAALFAAFHWSLFWRRRAWFSAALMWLPGIALMPLDERGNPDALSIVVVTGTQFLATSLAVAFVLWLVARERTDEGPAASIA